VDTGSEPTGLLQRARRLARLLGGLIQARTRLFLVELQEERLQLISVLLLAMGCLWCTGMTLMLLTFLVAVLFWEEHRVLVLVLLTLAWAAGAALLLWSLRRRLREWRPFAATREQFKKDAEWFGTVN
jgi:uncharacterized membrane protein YqjE